MATLFVSDLHLDPAHPGALARFLDFVERRALGAETLYVLGDLFEAWIGDDEDDPGIAPVRDALAQLHETGVRCAFMHGNRDFLIGEKFTADTGCELLEDYALIELAGERVLLTHGDLLCTDDEPYQALRATVRDPAWQREFLAKPLDERRALARELRERSQSETASKPEDIMDVNQQAVERALRRYEATTLIHGHTHRPGVHRFDLDGAPARRIVLGAWYEHDSVLEWRDGQFSFEGLGGS